MRSLIMRYNPHPVQSVHQNFLNKFQKIWGRKRTIDLQFFNPLDLETRAGITEKFITNEVF